VESLGAEFLTVDIDEEGGGAGGYGKEMSKVSHYFFTLSQKMTLRLSWMRRWHFSCSKLKRWISSLQLLSSVGPGSFIYVEVN
jgi:hypothetical protein